MNKTLTPLIDIVLNFTEWLVPQRHRSMIDLEEFDHYLLTLESALVYTRDLLGMVSSRGPSCYKKQNMLEDILELNRELAVKDAAFREMSQKLESMSSEPTPAQTSTSKLTLFDRVKFVRFATYLKMKEERDFYKRCLGKRRKLDPDISDDDSGEKEELIQTQSKPSQPQMPNLNTKEVPPVEILAQPSSSQPTSVLMQNFMSCAAIIEKFPDTCTLTKPERETIQKAWVPIMLCLSRARGITMGEYLLEVTQFNTPRIESGTQTEERRCDKTTQWENPDGNTTVWKQVDEMFCDFLDAQTVSQASCPFCHAEIPIGQQPEASEEVAVADGVVGKAVEVHCLDDIHSEVYSEGEVEVEDIVFETILKENLNLHQKEIGNNAGSERSGLVTPRASDFLTKTLFGSAFRRDSGFETAEASRRESSAVAPDQSFFGVRVDKWVGFNTHRFERKLFEQ